MCNWIRGAVQLVVRNPFAVCALGLLLLSPAWTFLASRGVWLGIPLGWGFSVAAVELGAVDRGLCDSEEAGACEHRRPGSCKERGTRLSVPGSGLHRLGIGLGRSGPVAQFGYSVIYPLSYRIIIEAINHIFTGLIK